MPAVEQGQLSLALTHSAVIEQPASERSIGHVDASDNEDAHATPNNSRTRKVFVTNEDTFIGFSVLMGSGVLTACLPTPQHLADSGRAVDSDSGFPDAGPPPDAGTAPNAGSLPSVALSMNTVAVLFTPPATSSSGLMTLATPGRGGPPLSQAHFAALPPPAEQQLTTATPNAPFFIPHRVYLQRSAGASCGPHRFRQLGHDGHAETRRSRC